jgi:DNA primase
VDYSSGYFLFSSPVTWANSVDPFLEPTRIVQVREAAQEGKYISVASASPYGRLRYVLNWVTSQIDETVWVLVEGPVDALAVVQVLNREQSVPLFVVAICGKLPEAIPFGKVVALFDGDDAGRAFAQEAGHRYVEQGRSVTFIPLLETFDPASIDPSSLSSMLERIGLRVW